MILPRPLASILLQLDPGRKAALAAETARSTSALGFGGDVELVFIYLFFTCSNMNSERYLIYDVPGRDLRYWIVIP